MAFKNFHLNCALRLIFIIITQFVLIYFLLEREYYLTTSFLGIFLIVQFCLFIKFIEDKYRKITDFFESIKYDDFTKRYSEQEVGEPFDTLNQELNSLIAHFHSLRSEKEIQYFYLQNIIQHINVGLIVFKGNQTVELINNCAKKLLGIRKLENISEIREINKDLYEKIISLESGEKDIFDFKVENENTKISISTKQFKLKNNIVTLIALQNIQNELENQELDAWQKLISVLTHEIMNSVTPISSLAETLGNIIDNASQKYPDLHIEELDDIKMAITTINKRSAGLLSFVQSYRSLTKIPEPKFKLIAMENLFENLETLFQREMRNRGIDFEFSLTPKSLKIYADEEQLSQVIINLIKNAIDALENHTNGKILLRGYTNNLGKAIIEIEDNGKGINPDIMEKIFVPFFSTKKEGSGIGLSLSKQILKKNKGIITVDSKENEKTIFRIKF